MGACRGVEGNKPRQEGQRQVPDMVGKGVWTLFLRQWGAAEEFFDYRMDMIRAALGKDGFDRESRREIMDVIGNVGPALTLNNLLSTYYVPVIKLNAGDAKRTKALPLSCPTEFIDG